MTKVPEMWSITMAVNKTGLSRKYVYTLIANRQIKYIKSGRKYLVNAQSLCDYLTMCDDNG